MLCLFWALFIWNIKTCCALFILSPLYLKYKNLLCFVYFEPFFIWRVLRYQRGNQNPYIEDEQTTPWSKEKVQKDKQRSTKHTYKTKDRVTRIPLNTGGELRCSWRVSSSCSTSDTRRVNLVTYPVTSHLFEIGKTWCALVILNRFF